MALNLSETERLAIDELLTAIRLTGLLQNSSYLGQR